ncbi:MAG: hypothetical protein KME26_09290 [Oscillatoria princeps RMCB-10]|nr:hypothetical protein [Oscillatoria princeps RMCB-10]
MRAIFIRCGACGCVGKPRKARIAVCRWHPDCLDLAYPIWVALTLQGQSGGVPVLGLWYNWG